MSSVDRESRGWGPAHQRLDPPFRPRAGTVLAVLFALVLFVPFALALRHGLLGRWVLVALALTVGLALARDLVAVLWRVVLARGPAARARTGAPVGVLPRAGVVAPVRGRAVSLRAGVARAGGGVYLGVDGAGGLVVAERESAVMVLGPPRSGKTSAVMIPALLGCGGAAVSTSTKRDVMDATVAARSEVGQAWLFDPAGEEDRGVWESGLVRRLCWSPVRAASGWDEALVVARAMSASSGAGRGTSNESHWSERAGALLAPLLFAANLSGATIGDVLRWTLRQDLEPAREILADGEARVAEDVLAGIERTDARERSSIFSATAGVLSAYNADAVRDSASRANFDPGRFVDSGDTLYITAPEHKQALCAPLIVGLLEEIRHEVYRRARERGACGGGGSGMLWLLDEVANIAPIRDLPALVSQAGGQGLQVVVGLQDLSQARVRWGQDAADGFLSLFQTRLVLNGIADPRTLEAISLALGEYDRQVVGESLARSDPHDWRASPTFNTGATYHTQRQRVVSPGEVARLPDGHALLLQSGDWRLVGLRRWHEQRP